MSEPLLVQAIIAPPGIGMDQNWYLLFEKGQMLPIHAKRDADVRIGKYVKVSLDTKLGMPGKPLEKLVIGDGTTIYGGLIAPSKFVCGDYVTIHKEVFIYGRSACVIGHNSWFGMRCTLDCEGTHWEVGNNFGAGQDTHMWSHIAHGDMLEGCKYNDHSAFGAGDDVWLVGRCTSAPAYHASKSVALTESNLTKGMGQNTVWGGNPAKDLTERLGTPYPVIYHNDTDMKIESERRQKKWDYALYCYKFDNEIGYLKPEILKGFNITDRTYEKDIENSEVQNLFLYMLKKKKIKFVPVNNQRVTLNNV